MEPKLEGKNFNLNVCSSFAALVLALERRALDLGQRVLERRVLR